MAYLTVVTYGRTGSTAIQAALNALPGVVIRGENYSAMRGLREYLQAVAETADRHHAGRPDHPWYGSARLDPPAVLNDLRRHVVEFILRPSRGTRVIGFKEVRYEPGHFATYELMLDYLIFLGQLFPGLNYLMNVRDPAEAARSGWWPGNDQALEVLGTTREWWSMRRGPRIARRSSTHSTGSACRRTTLPCMRHLPAGSPTARTEHRQNRPPIRPPIRPAIRLQ